MISDRFYFCALPRFVVVFFSLYLRFLYCYRADVLVLVILLVTTMRRREDSVAMKRYDDDANDVFVFGFFCFFSKICVNEFYF